jgi:hypothetical protein
MVDLVWIQIFCARPRSGRREPGGLSAVHVGKILGKNHPQRAESQDQQRHDHHENPQVNSVAMRRLRTSSGPKAIFGSVASHCQENRPCNKLHHWNGGHQAPPSGPARVPGALGRLDAAKNTRASCREPLSSSANATMHAPDIARIASDTAYEREPIRPLNASGFCDMNFPGCDSTIRRIAARCVWKASEGFTVGKSHLMALASTIVAAKKIRTCVGPLAQFRHTPHNMIHQHRGSYMMKIREGHKRKSPMPESRPT